MNLSTYGATALMDSTTMPATLYAKLHIGNPSAAGTANPATETTRKGSTRTTGSPVATNVSAMTWASYPATEPITHITLWDHVSAGNCWWVGDAPGSVNAGENVEIAIGDLELTFEVWT